MLRHILLAFSLMTISLNAQNKGVVEARFDIYLDGNKMETDSIYVGLTSSKNAPEMIRIVDSFTTWLDLNKVYNVVVTHPRYHKQVLNIDTNKGANKLQIKIYLNNGEPDCYMGYLKYNNFLKTYVNRGY